LAFDEQVNHRLRGVSREESLRTIYAHNRRAPPAEAEFAALCERKNARFRELVAAMTERDALPGARELLAALRQAGVRLAVASASRNARAVLERTGLAKLVDALADGNLLTASKPDPQVFYLAAQRLRCLPWNCVGLEDAPAGIEALHRAGMPAVGIGPAVRAAGADEAEDLAAADWVAPGVKEVTAESLLRLFAGKQNRRDPYYERNVAKMKSEMS
jgi:beta-phosphoglucomutase